MEGTRFVKEDGMVEYSAVVEGHLKWFYRSLSEKDRRQKCVEPTRLQGKSCRVWPID